MKKKLVLAGSGEFTDSMAGVDRFLLDLIPSKNKKVIILPTAAGKEAGFNDWTERGVTYFKKLGANPVGVNVTNKDQANDKEFVNQLDGADFIYFSGGDPGYLRETLKDSLLWKKIMSLYENGSILAGSSAGAMVMGPYVLGNAQRLESMRETPEWDESFEMINYSVIPHFDFIKSKMSFMFNKIIKKVPEHVLNRLIGIDENTVLYIRDGHQAQVLGKSKVHVFEDGQTTEHGSGDNFDLK